MAGALWAVWWFVLVELLGLAALPLTLSAYPSSSGNSLGFSRLLGILILGFLSWALARFGILAHNFFTLAVTFILLLIAGIGWLAVSWHRLRPILAAQKDSILRLECLFFAVYVLFLIIRSFAPEILDAEKFMDFAFVNACVRSDTVPPPDPWCAGQPSNYYYFGHYLFATLMELGSVPPRYGYNLAMAWIAAATFSASMGLVRWVTKSGVAGVLAGVFVVFLGNFDGAIQLFTNEHLTDFSYWQSSRVIEGTINEFPFFSFIHADLHAHVMVLPFGVLTLSQVMEVVVGPRPPFPLLVTSSLALASVGAINPWSFPAQTLALILAVIVGRLHRRGDVGAQHAVPLPNASPLPIFPMAIVIVAAAAICAGVYKGISSPLGGLGWVKDPTALRYLAIIFGLFGFCLASLWIRSLVTLVDHGPKRMALAAGMLFFTMSLGSVLNSITLGMLVSLACLAVGYGILQRESENGRVLTILALVGILVILFTEIVYFKDIYSGKNYRLNTVFKFQIQAWLFLALAAACALGEMYKRYSVDVNVGAKHSGNASPLPRIGIGTWFWMGCLGLLFLACCVYPILGTASRDFGFKRAPSLDGIRYLAKNHSDDYWAICWLNNNVKGSPVIVEAVGDDYSYAGRISSNTGLPTIMGWVGHEQHWRGKSDIAQREKDAKNVYASRRMVAVKRILDKYNVEYVVVGELERRQTPPELLEKFNLLDKAFQSGDTVIYRVPQRKGPPAK